MNENVINKFWRRKLHAKGGEYKWNEILMELAARDNEKNKLPNKINF